MDIFNILITGVGGQGAVRIGNILREFGMRSSFIKNVVGTETRGVSQREGSVTSTVRFLIESKVFSLEEGYEIDDLVSPGIPINDAHLVIGFEPLETLRNLKFISEKTLVLINTHKHYPRNVITGSETEKKYPSNAKILDILNQFARRVISMNFKELSEIKLNNSIYSNVIMLGAVVKEFEVIFNEKDLMVDVLKDFFGDSKQNLKAFEIGYNLIQNY